MAAAAQDVMETPAHRRVSAAVHPIDPLRDPRWNRLVESHPAASIFHTQGWLEALRRTYNYEPVVLTTTGNAGDLENGLVLCKVSSWLTGNRLVSLSFSDHCQPLVDGPAALHTFLNHLEEQVRAGKFKYAELRPLTAFDAATETAARASIDRSFCIHMLDLRPPADALLQCFHKNHIQRKIARAKKEGLQVETGRSAKLLDDFFRLLLITRRRHGIPPQPLAWFRNVLECVGEQAAIRVAYKGRTPVASIFTVTHKKTMVYKYGCSDGAFGSMGGTPYLFWDAMQEAKKQGLEEFDFGRSEIDNEGLVNFKDHWGTTRTNLHYYRYPFAAAATAPQGKGWKMKFAERVCEKLPDTCLTVAGKLLYRHVG
jgi:CelD/BcsL family acetyltransferase involved in cellulose biosynthesis